jgi:hypothetical protein
MHDIVNFWFWLTLHANRFSILEFRIWWWQISVTCKLLLCTCKKQISNLIYIRWQRKWKNRCTLFHCNISYTCHRSRLFDSHLFPSFLPYLFVVLSFHIQFVSRANSTSHIKPFFSRDRMHYTSLIPTPGKKKMKRKSKLCCIIRVW